MVEQKQRSEFPEKELWDLTAFYQDREVSYGRLKKLVKTLTSSYGIIRTTSILLRILKKPLPNWNKSILKEAISATTVLCYKQQTIAMKVLPRLLKLVQISKQKLALLSASLMQPWSMLTKKFLIVSNNYHI